MIRRLLSLNKKSCQKNILDIFRVYYNYCLAGKNKQTPAMRIGLAKGVVPLEDIIYFESRTSGVKQ